MNFAEIKQKPFEWHLNDWDQGNAAINHYMYYKY